MTPPLRAAGLALRYAAELHHPARADPERGRRLGQMRDQDRRRRAGDTGHVVVFGDPEPVISEALHRTGEVNAGSQRGTGGGPRVYRYEVEHGQAYVIEFEHIRTTFGRLSGFRT